MKRVQKYALKASARRALLISLLLLFCFVLFTIAVVKVDVRPIGPEGSSVGFASINGAVRDAFPFSHEWYGISSKIGYLIIAFAVAFAGLGGLQMFRRKSLLKVDSELLLLGAFYVVMFVLYILFDKIALNYRPFIIDPAEGLEPSYPSTHTLLAICIGGTGVLQVKRIFAERPTVSLLSSILLVFLIALQVVTRLVSGVHWLTDILGSLMMGSGMVAAYTAGVRYIQLKKE